MPHPAQRLGHKVRCRGERKGEGQGEEGRKGEGPGEDARTLRPFWQRYRRGGGQRSLAVSFPDTSIQACAQGH